MLTNMMMTY